MAAKLDYFLSAIPCTPLLALLLFLSSSAAATASFLSSSAAATASVHDLLQEHGLPGGLFPKAVESFSHDAASGLLEVRLSRPCYARYDDGLAYFDTVVRGNLTYGALRCVVGWSQEELFLWLPVKGIVVTDPASGVILFDIGVARKRLAAAAFEDPPNCHPEVEAAAGALELLGRRTGLQQQR